MSNDNLNSGYILMSRGILNSSIWLKPPLYAKVFFLLLLKAQHKDYKGLKRGQLFINYKDIISETSWYSGNRRDSATKDQIQNVMEWLRNPLGVASGGIPEAPMITTVKATHGTLVTICNYNTYQDPKAYESNSESNSGNFPGATREQQQASDINKNGKNAKHYKNDNTLLPETDDFKLFWDKYNKSVGKQDCIKLYAKIPKSDKDLIMAHLEKYILSTPDTKYRKDPATYLKRKAWLDEIIPYKPISSKQTLPGAAKLDYSISDYSK